MAFLSLLSSGSRYGREHHSIVVPAPTVSSSNLYYEPSELPLPFSNCIKSFYLVSSISSLIDPVRAPLDRSTGVGTFEEATNEGQYFLKPYLHVLKMLGMQLLSNATDTSDMSSICGCAAFPVRLVSKAFLRRKVRLLNSRGSHRCGPPLSSRKGQRQISSE